MWLSLEGSSMRKWGSAVALVLGCVWLVADVAPLSAHHSFSAEFDTKQPITLKGTISKMMWVNPHAWL